MVLRHVSILKDHLQGVCLYLAKVTELFKRFEEFFKFKTLNLKSRWLTRRCGSNTVAGVCCDPCGAMRWQRQRMAPQGSQHTPATILLPQRRVNHRDFKFSVLN